MSILVYNTSSQLADYLIKIDNIRKEIHLTPLSPKEELRHRWEAKIERTYWSLNLAGLKVSKRKVGETLLNSSGKPLSQEQKAVINYTKATDYISYNWLASERKVTPSSIKKLYDISCRETEGSSERSYKSNKKELNHVLSYLQEGTDHPIIQAGIAYIQMYNISPFSKGEGRIARLVAYLFLYKLGYDFRGLLVFDELLKKDINAFHEARASVEEQKTLTLWLEYLAYTIGVQADKALQIITTKKFTTDLPAKIWKLNGRQKEVLSLVEKPGSRITNKEVQKYFKISQITASRDLAKLTKLKLLFTHGKGRSTYYTRGVVI